jgi:hypothetical protein
MAILPKAIYMHDLFDLLLSCLPRFCWESLRLHSLKILVYNSLLWLHLSWIWNEHNIGFIEWVWQCSFPSYFLEKFEECWYILKVW